MDQHTGKYIIIAGVLILIMGLLIYFFHDKMQWIGKLPGDIRIERGNTKVYFPFTTMILFSILVSVIVQLVKKFL